MSERVSGTQGRGTAGLRCRWSTMVAGYSAAPDYPEVAKGALGEMADTVESRSLMRMV